MFFSNYQKPGKGVEKRDPEKPRILVFFELFFRKFWNLCKVNLLYIITAIPFALVLAVLAGLISSPITNAVMPILQTAEDMMATDHNEFLKGVLLIDSSIRIFVVLFFAAFLGMGPVTAGVTYILRNYAREEHAWILSDFWDNFKSNFGQGFLVWIIDISLCIVFGIALKVYSGMGIIGGVLSALVLSFLVIYLMMHFYMYQMMVTFKLPIKDLFKNSLIFTIQDFFKNLLLFAVLLVIHVVSPLVCLILGKGLLVFVILEVIILMATSGFLTNFFVYPTTEKYIKIANKNKENNADLSE